MDRRRVVAVFLLILHGAIGLIALPAVAGEAGEISVLLSEPAGAYREVADAVHAAVGKRYAISVKLLDELADGELRGMDRPGHLVVPVGVRALRRVADTYSGKASVLSLLVPKAAMDAIPWAAGAGGKVSAVYLDQPIHRLLALIGHIQPKIDRVGVLLAEEKTELAREIRTEAARRRMQVQMERVSGSRDVSAALQRLLPAVDVLLLVPDPLVVNENNARLILVSSYRQHVPVVAFSRGLVNAGAVASVVSDPDHIGREGAALIQQWNPQTGLLPPARPATLFDIAVNRQVARSLGTEIRNDEELLRQLREGD